jgi:hypothetical protein
MSDKFEDEVQAAFPDRYRDGMTLRDYFAAEALSSPVCLEISLLNNWDNERRSEWAYKQADAMLKAREV